MMSTDDLAQDENFEESRTASDQDEDIDCLADLGMSLADLPPERLQNPVRGALRNFYGIDAPPPPPARIRTPSRANIARGGCCDSAAQATGASHLVESQMEAVRVAVREEAARLASEAAASLEAAEEKAARLALAKAHRKILMDTARRAAEEKEVRMAAEAAAARKAHQEETERKDAATKAQDTMQQARRETTNGAMESESSDASSKLDTDLAASPLTSRSSSVTSSTRSSWSDKGPITPSPGRV
jgi:pyruvate/2-oxoglutarate dehydrogenase complex dihydrolipoamide acyltransferase (E2) component